MHIGHEIKKVKKTQRKRNYAGVKLNNERKLKRERERKEVFMITPLCVASHALQHAVKCGKISLDR